MLKTRLNPMVVVGLAMIGLFLGQVFPAVAATTASHASHVNSTKKIAAVPARHKSQKNIKSVRKTPSMSGMASVYSDRFRGRKTSSGQRFNQEKMTAAHRTLPIGTKVLVTNLHNNKS
ncbi:MAG: septal ring lytic transglycosylase RlpA family protein, partial [Desulfobulbus sp.]